MPESLQTVEAQATGPAGVASSERPSIRRRLRVFVGDHPFLAVFLTAFLARLLVAIVLSVSGQLVSVAPDSAFFVDFATQLAGGPIGTTGTFWSSASHYATYLVPVSLLFRIFGPSFFLAQLVAVVFGSVAATATARLAKEFLPQPWAVGAGMVVALFPSQVLWSSAAIRDSTVWATSSCMALALALLLRAESRRRIVLLVAATFGCMFFFGYVREYALSISAFSIFIVALVVRSARFRIVIAVVLALGAMFIPVAFDRDILGVRILSANELSRVRVGNAAGADSAFVNPDELNKSDLAHLPQGLKVTLLEPLPWTSLNGSSASWGRLEAPLRWLLLIGTLGAAPLLWRRRRELGFVALYAAGIVLVLALAEGNFGTLDRHRGELVWPMTLLTVTAVHARWTGGRRGTWLRDRLRSLGEWVRRSPDVAVGIVAGAVRGVMFAARGVVSGADSTLYVKIAKSIADGSPKVFDFPLHIGYPVFLAPGQLLGIAVNTWVVLLHIALGIGTAIAFRRLARLFVRPGPALVVGLIVACYPSLLFWTRYVLTEALFVFALSLFALACAHVVVDGEITRRRVTGLVLSGIFVLFSRPTGLPIVLTGAVVLVYVVVSTRGGARAGWRAVAVVAVGLVMLTSLVLAVRPTRGVILANPSVAVSLSHSRRIWTSDINHVLAGQYKINPYAADESWDKLSDRSLDWIGDHPGVYAVRAGMRFGNYWFPWLTAAWTTPHLAEDVVLTLLLYGGAIAGLVLARNGPQRRLATLLALLGLVQGIAVMFSQIDSEARYRLPAEVVLVPLVGIVLERVVDKRRSASRSSGERAGADESVPARSMT